MGRTKRILVVEDETGIRSLLSDVLIRNGFDVSMAKDGQESLDQLEDSYFDLVITDIHMPRLDGIEMLKSMKKTGRKEKVIIMTGNISDQRLTDPGIPPVVTRLEKPFKIDKFLDVVASATAGAKAMSRIETQQAAIR
ncbi:MAG TPA: two-component system response regulator [Desulfobacteraceae bacterium]|nr:two-component system response regulator [Desulfobacteraceae bacterium]